MIGETDPRFKHLESKIGLFVLMALIGCVVVAVFIAAESDLFTPKYTLRFTVDKGTGFAKGMPVKLSGFRIGRIESIALNSEARVDIVLQIDRQYQQWLRRDSVARQVKEGLVGDAIIELSAGSKDQPLLEDGQIIVFERGKSIDEHVTELTDQVKPVLLEVKEIISYVNDPRGDIKQTLRNIEVLTRGLETTRDKSDQLIDTARVDVDAISRQVVATLNQAEKSVKALDATVARLDHVAANVEERLPALLERVEATLKHVEGVAADVRKMTVETSPRVPRLLRRTEETLDDTGQVVRAVKSTWPISSHLPPLDHPQLLPVDSHE